MRLGCFDRKSLAAAALVAAAMAAPLAGVAQDNGGIRYQPPTGMQAPGLLLQPRPLPTPTAITPNGVVVEDVIVRVNDTVITRSDLEKAQQQMVQELQQQNASAVEASTREHDMLRDMIDEQLLLSRAKETDVNVDAEVVRRLDDIRKQNHLDSMEALQKAAADQNISFEDFKAQIRNQLLTQTVISEEVTRHLQRPTQADEQAYYEAHKNEFVQPEQVGLEEILIPTAADANDAALAQAKAKADAVGAAIKGGANFEDEAKKESGGPTAAQGGELGLYKRGPLGQVLEDATFNLPVGGVTDPIRTRQGYVILKVTQHLAAGPVPLKQVQNEVDDAMFREEMQPALRNYLTKLREDAYIDLAPGFVDSGASANEGKTVYESSTPPESPKAKKKAARIEKASNQSAPTAAPAVPALPPASASAEQASTSVPPLPAASTNGSSSAAPATTSTTPQRMRASSVSKTVKKKKIRREKVRYGQAPRSAIAPGKTEVAATPTGNAAPGAVMTLQGATNSEVASNTTNTDVNPLDPTAAPEKKTRFAATAPYGMPKALKKPTKMQKEKAVAKSSPMSTDEKQTQQVQSAALGLEGDNSKKKKKQKRAKGDPKERLQDKPAAQPTGPAPTVNPNIGAPIPGASSSQTPSQGNGGSAGAPAKT